jgi:serine/threonine-protein kinase
MHDIGPGDVLDQRFQITDVIQKSGMSTIYKAIDCDNGRFVAIKIPHMQLESDAAYFSRFKREEEIGLKLDHPGIVKIVSMQNKSRPYIVMEVLEGQTLDHLLNELRPFPTDRALEIARKLCEVLDYMHRNDVVHRDLKPGNIMVCDDGSLRIIDFGIAKSLAMNRITFGGFSPKMGTPHYMAPEQIKGKRGDARTDIYSLGAILYEMITGALPFIGESTFDIMNARLMDDPKPPREINPAVSPQIEEIILHALEREPSSRYASAAEMKAELDSPQTVIVTGRRKGSRWPAKRKEQLRRAGLIFFGGHRPHHLFLFVSIDVSAASAESVA